MAAPRPQDQPSFDERLAGIGLRYQALKEAVGASNTERERCSPHSIKTAPGFYAYNGLVAGLSGLRADKWERINLGGVLPLWVHTGHRIRLVVTSGNALTGLHYGEEPRSRYPKGELVQQMVKQNKEAEMNPLFDLAMDADGDRDPIADFDLWALMIYFDKAKSEIRSEVSRPKGVTGRGFIGSWTHRIVLPPYEVIDMSGDDPNEGFGEVDVPVIPR
jgi:hypothetical protein